MLFVSNCVTLQGRCSLLGRCLAASVYRVGAATAVSSLLVTLLAMGLFYMSICLACWSIEKVAAYGRAVMRHASLVSLQKISRGEKR